MKRVVSACPKDHEKSMPTPLKFDRTCDFDIMTYVRKRRVTSGAIVHRLKSKENIRPPAMSTLLKVCSDKVIKESWKASTRAHEVEVNKLCKICSCALKSSIYFKRVSADLELADNVRIALIL